ncbi:unnamed protein product, partial [marine sediment metagenome]
VESRKPMSDKAGADTNEDDPQDELSTSAPGGSVVWVLVSPFLHLLDGS